MENFQKLIKCLPQRMQILNKLCREAFKQIAAEESYQISVWFRNECSLVWQIALVLMSNSEADKIWIDFFIFTLF